MKAQTLEREAGREALSITFAIMSNGDFALECERSIVVQPKEKARHFVLLFHAKG